MITPDALEKALRASLQPVDPGAVFAAALQSRLAQADLPARVPVGGAARRLHPASLALAASIVVALGVSWQLQDLRAAQSAAQARVHAQLLLALEITGERLELAQQRIEQFQTKEYHR